MADGYGTVIVYVIVAVSDPETVETPLFVGCTVTPMYLVSGVPLARLLPIEVGAPELVDMAESDPMPAGAELACTTLKMLLNVAKFVDMFRRRVEKGQCFKTPYLGTRECAADVLPADDAPPPIDETRPLGRILWYIDYDAPAGISPHFFDAELVRGVLRVPARPTNGGDVA